MISDAPARRAAYLAALVLILAGGALRLQQAWSHRGVYLPTSMQEEGYYETAIGLLSYRTFSVGVPNATPSAWRGPIYPVFIALLESFSPDPDPGRVRLAQAAAATFSILLIFALGWAVYSPGAGLLAAALLALDAEQAAAVASLNIHGFYSFIILATCAALVLWSERPTAKSTLLMGVFIGLTLLCRSSHFLLVPFMAAAAWLWRPLPGPRWRAPALLILGAALALAPMAVRNRAVAGRWLLFPDAYAGAVALFGATTGHQGLKSYSVEQAIALAEEAAPGFKASVLTEGDLHPALLDLAVRRIFDDPLRFAGLCLRRLGLLARALWLPFVLGLAGLALQRRNRRLQIALILAFSFASYGLAGGAPEHQAAAMPLLYLLAGCGGAILLGRLAGAPPAKPASTAGWRRRVLAAPPLAAALLYAACLLALAVEARQRLWNDSPPPLEKEGRALALLRGQAERGGERERRTYGENLARNGVRWAEAGDCERAAPGLRRSLRLEPRRPAVAGTLAACLAAGGDSAGARSLAAALRGRPTRDRAEFWDACIRQSERLGDKADLSLLSPDTIPGDDARRRIIGLWIKRAEAAAGRGDRASLLDSLAQVVRLDPNDAERKRIVDYYRELKEYREAGVQLDSVLERRVLDPEFWLLRAEIAARSGEGPSALRWLRRVERLPSLSSLQQRRVIGLYRELKEDGPAAASLERLLRAEPRDPALLLDHAELMTRLNRRSKALSSLSAAEGLSTMTEAQRRRAVGLYRHLQEPRRGDAALAPLLEREPKDAGLWLERAAFKSQEGDRDAALSALARAEELGSLTPQSRRLLVGFYRDLKAPRRGAAALAPLLESAPRDAGLWIDKAEFSAQAGERTEALDALSRAEKLPSAGESDAGELRRRLALVFQSLGEHGRALAILAELTRSYPAEGKFFADKGLCEYLGGDARAAIATLETAIRLKPKFIPAYLTLGAIHSTQGRRGEALGVYDRGLARSPAAERDPLRGVLLDARAAAAAAR